MDGVWRKFYAETNHETKAIRYGYLSQTLADFSYGTLINFCGVIGVSPGLNKKNCLGAPLHAEKQFSYRYGGEGHKWRRKLCFSSNKFMYNSIILNLFWHNRSIFYLYFYCIIFSIEKAVDCAFFRDFSEFFSGWPNFWGHISLVGIFWGNGSWNFIEKYSV